MNKKHKFAVLAAAAVLSISMLAGCGNNDDTSQNIGDNNAVDSSGTLVIAEQGMFSAGGTVPVSYTHLANLPLKSSVICAAISLARSVFKS